MSEIGWRWASSVPDGQWFKRLILSRSPAFAWVRIPGTQDYIRYDLETGKAVVRDDSQVNFWAPFQEWNGELP